MENPNHSTFAQTLWRYVLRGRQTEAEAVESFVRCVEEPDFKRQIDSMPEAMLDALARYVAPDPAAIEEGFTWSREAASSCMLVAHAFDFDFEKAREWKAHRFELIHDLIAQRRRSNGV